MRYTDFTIVANEASLVRDEANSTKRITFAVLVPGILGEPQPSAIASERDLRDYFRLDVAGARARIAELVEAGELQRVTVESLRGERYLARDAASGDGEWPADVWGSFGALQRLGNGQRILTLSAGGSVVFVRDVPDAQLRKE